MKDFQIRKKIHPKQKVMVLLKEDYETGILTPAIVEEVLTQTEEHYRGIKVRIQKEEHESEEVKQIRMENPDYRRIGRVKEIVKYRHTEPH